MKRIYRVVLMVIVVVAAAGSAFAQNCATCEGTAQSVSGIRYNMEQQLQNPDIMNRRITYAVHATPQTVQHYWRCCLMTCQPGSNEFKEIQNNLRWINWAIRELPQQGVVVVH